MVMGLGGRGILYFSRTTCTYLGGNKIIYKKQYFLGKWLIRHEAAFLVIGHFDTIILLALQDHERVIHR